MKPPPPAAAPDPPPDPGRAAGLLERMHRVHGHDLPNQIVALQTLVQMLEMDEAPSLSDAGREYLARIARVADNAMALARFLREMAQLRDYRPQDQDVGLPALLRGAAAELERIRPEVTFHFAPSAASPGVRGDARLLQRAVAELVHLAVGRAGPEERAVRAEAAATPAGVELTLTVEAPGRGDLDQAIELTLVRERLHLAGGRLLAVSGGTACRFTLLLRAATAHG